MMLLILHHSEPPPLDLPGLPPSLLCDLASCLPGTRLAVVGGCVRDLLLHREHRDPWRGLMDLDLVLEAPVQMFVAALQCASEFQVRSACVHGRYGTVEIEIVYQGVDLFLDVAQARCESYPRAAGVPLVRPDRLEADLSRRDFSINAIAILLDENGSAPVLLDRHAGMDDLRKRELKFLHQCSVKDDPTRLIRAARYAARLGFSLAPSSISQCRQTLADWPWDWRVGDPPGLAPVSLATRLRMELELLFVREPWMSALALLQSWGGFVLLDERLQADRHWARRLRWALRLGLPLLPALLMEAQDPLAVARRLRLPHGQERLLEQAQLLKQRFLRLASERADVTLSRSDWGWSPARWTAWLEQPGGSVEAVALLLAAAQGPRRPLLRWWARWRKVQSPISAAQLMELEGLQPGPRLGQRLRELRFEGLDLGERP
jgi:poly(A) polymerase